jgi:chromosome segregation ATPase
MFKNFKTAGSLFASIFSLNPPTDEQKEALEGALESDISEITAAETAVLTADVTRLTGELEAANTAKDTAETQVTDLTATIATQSTELARLTAIEPEYNTLKAQADEYQRRIGGQRPKDANGAAAGGEELNGAEEIERLKNEYKYSMGGI